MKKILEALKSLLPEDQLKEVAAAVDEMMKEATEEISKAKEAEFNKQLESAYNELSAELKTSEKTAEQGYEEAYAIIVDLRNRLDKQKEEFEKTLEEGYEEAYQLLLAERAKSNTLEVDLHEEYEKKYSEMKTYFVEMIHQFLQNKGSEIYEQAIRDALSDPRHAERKVALDKIIEIASGYINDEEVMLATSSKLEEAHKKIETLAGQIKIMEARNIRITREKEKIEEAHRVTKTVVAESNKNEKKERVEKAKNVSGRGQIVTEQETKVISENNTESAQKTKETSAPSKLLESLGDLSVMNTLAGTKVSQ